MTSTASAFPVHPAGYLRRGFELTKWYVDVVAPDGRGAIAYWAELHWHGVHGTAGSILTFGPAEPTVVHTTLQPGPPPTWTGRTIDWAMPALGASVLLHVRDSGTAIRLLGEPDATLDWNCVAPRGPAHIGVGGRACDGTGYAEVLRMTLPPWRLPADEVRWGRALVGEQSVVWLRWSGDCPREVVLLDGRQVPGTVHADRIELPGGAVHLGAPHVIRSGAVGDVVRPLRVLWPLLPQTLREMREEKWLAPVRRRAADGREETGWAIHELVSLPH
jgi:hypothetical protein